jgi:hypothetical protein
MIDSCSTKGMNTKETLTTRQILSIHLPKLHHHRPPRRKNILHDPHRSTHLNNRNVPKHQDPKVEFVQAHIDKNKSRLFTQIDECVMEVVMMTSIYTFCSSFRRQVHKCKTVPFFLCFHTQLSSIPIYISSTQPYNSNLQNGRPLQDSRRFRHLREGSKEASSE